MHGRWAYLSHLKFLQLKGLNTIIGLINGVFAGKSGNVKDLISHNTLKIIGMTLNRKRRRKLNSTQRFMLRGMSLGNCIRMCNNNKNSTTHTLHLK
jgi:hypothetical protein